MARAPSTIRGSRWALLLALAGCEAGSGLPVASTTLVSVTALPLSLQVSEDSPLQLHLTALVAPADVGAPVFEILEPPTHGQLEGDPPDLLYRPDPDAHGLDSFRFSATVDRASSEAQVVLDVLEASDAPVAGTTRALTAEDEAVTGHLDASDPDFDPLWWSVAGPPAHGAFALDPANGTFEYTPEPDWSGTDEVVWAASDGALTTGLVHLVIDVVPMPDEPVADDLVLAGEEDAVVRATLSATDADGEALSFTVTDPPDRGAVELDPRTGELVWTPDPDAAGTDQLRFVASDGATTSAPALVRLTLSPVDDPPVAADASLEVQEDTPGEVTVVATDPDAVQPPSFELMSYPSRGTATIEPDTGLVRYLPDPDVSGADAFVVLVSSGALFTAARVEVVIHPAQDPPVAFDEDLVTTADQSLSGVLRGTDPDGDPLVFAIDGPPAHGRAAMTSDTAFRYVPDPLFVGTDTFTFVADDGLSTSAPAEIRIEVAPWNGAPQPTDVEWTIPQDVTSTRTFSATDPDGDPVTYRIAVPPVHGSAGFTGDVLEVTPDPTYVGDDLLWYEVLDIWGTGAFARVSLHVLPDLDHDAVPDGVDTCPELADPLQQDVNGNGVGDACDCAADGFESGALDPAFWSTSAGVVLAQDEVADGLWSARFAGASASLELQPVDAGSCEGLDVRWAVKRAGNVPLPGSALQLEAWNGVAWVVVRGEEGIGVADPEFSVEQAWIPVGAAPGGLVRLRLSSRSGGAGLDSFYVDDVSVGCDSDADRIGDCRETEAGTTPGLPDTDRDGLDDGSEEVLGADPLARDTDADGVVDGLDVCPAEADPDQDDLDLDGVGDACLLEVADEFPDPQFGASWSDTSGDLTFIGTAASPPWAADFGGGGATATVTGTLPLACPALAWFAEVKRGPDAPEINDVLVAEVWADGWRAIGVLAGNGLVDPTYLPVGFATSDPALLAGSVEVRLRSQGSSAASDDFAVDDVHVGCDGDGDRLADVAEWKLLGTDELLLDTDGDGLDDGVELLERRTDPLDPQDP